VAVKLSGRERLLMSLVLIKPSTGSPFERGCTADELSRACAIRVGIFQRQGALG
jgi:hypothetical protein